MSCYVNILSYHSHSRQIPLFCVSLLRRCHRLIFELSCHYLMRINRAANCDIHRSPLKYNQPPPTKWGVDKRTRGPAWGATSVYNISQAINIFIYVLVVMLYISSTWDISGFFTNSRTNGHMLFVAVDHACVGVAYRVGLCSLPCETFSAAKHHNITSVIYVHIWNTHRGILIAIWQFNFTNIQCRLHMYGCYELVSFGIL